jgi:hypothetical protein
MGNVLMRKPISKAEALKAMSDDEVARVTQLKVKINDALPSYSGRPLRFDLPSNSTPKTVAMLKAYYEAPELGWKVEHEQGSSQRDNDSWNYITVG